MYLGSKTTRNINPIQMVAESNEVNQTRKACHMLLEKELESFHSPLVPGVRRDQSAEALAERIRQTNILCRSLHRDLECGFDWEAWCEDFEERRGVRPTSARFETEEEAQSRLDE